MCANYTPQYNTLPVLPLKKSKLLSKGEEDPHDSRKHQDIIGHDAPVRSRMLPDYNEHAAFEGHEKKDATSKVSDPPFTNLVQKSDSNEKPMLI